MVNTVTFTGPEKVFLRREGAAVRGPFTGGGNHPREQTLLFTTTMRNELSPYSAAAASLRCSAASLAAARGASSRRSFLSPSSCRRLNSSIYCYLFGPSSAACWPAASRATSASTSTSTSASSSTCTSTCTSTTSTTASTPAASPATASSPAATPGAAQISKVDLQLRCDVVGRFAEVVVGGIIRGAQLLQTDDQSMSDVTRGRSGNQ
ncbi:hypothetical protein EYF80_008310 [Liparis tanakae]|uniref:Uncharacterized protein n=1 Tax=Liparis tanakae TaxID=230148 RepID=A0A4Z2IVJ0_9TELE|nr:hypothetical protein EYF80_008310 [Liparis tanakae]